MWRLTPVVQRHLGCNASTLVASYFCRASPNAIAQLWLNAILAWPILRIGYLMNGGICVDSTIRAKHKHPIMYDYACQN